MNERCGLLAAASGRDVEDTTLVETACGRAEVTGVIEMFTV